MISNQRVGSHVKWVTGWIPPIYQVPLTSRVTSHTYVSSDPYTCVSSCPLELTADRCTSMRTRHGVCFVHSRLLVRRLGLLIHLRECRVLHICICLLRKARAQRRHSTSMVMILICVYKAYSYSLMFVIGMHTVQCVLWVTHAVFLRFICRRPIGVKGITNAHVSVDMTCRPAGQAVSPFMITVPTYRYPTLHESNPTFIAYGCAKICRIFWRGWHNTSPGILRFGVFL